MEEKKKELAFIEGVELVNLDDCNIPEKKWHYDNNDLDDNKGPNADGFGVHDGAELCLQTVESNDELASKLVAPEVGEHFEPHTMPIVAVEDPFFNAVDKASHPDAMIVKHEVGWFQLRAEKRQRIIAEQLAMQQEKERLAKKVEEARNQVAPLSQLFKRQYGGDIQAFLAGNVQVARLHPSANTPAPTVPKVPLPTFVLLQGASKSQPPSLVPNQSIYGPSLPDNLSYPQVKYTFAVSTSEVPLPDGD